MLIGKREDFCIEVFIEEDLDPPSAVWGRMRVWVEDHSFGDFDDPHCALYPAYEAFTSLIQKLDALYESDFLNLDPDECYRRVDEAIYGRYIDDELVDSEFDQYSQKYQKHNFLKNWGEMFDSTIKPFIFRNGELDLVVLQPDSWSGRIKEYKCSLKSFVSVVSEFIEWFDQTAKSLEK